MLSYKEDFGKALPEVSKTMTELGAAVKVEGEVTVRWEFVDDYRIE